MAARARDTQHKAKDSCLRVWQNTRKHKQEGAGGPALTMSQEEDEEMLQASPSSTGTSAVAETPSPAPSPPPPPQPLQQQQQGEEAIVEEGVNVQGALHATAATATTAAQVQLRTANGRLVYVPSHPQAALPSSHNAELNASLVGGRRSCEVHTQSTQHSLKAPSFINQRQLLTLAAV